VDILIVAGSALVVALALVGLAIVIVAARADRAQSPLSARTAQQTPDEASRARRFVRPVRLRSPTRR
jgi:type II secretory pathway component PulK